MKKINFLNLNFENKQKKVKSFLKIAIRIYIKQFIFFCVGFICMQRRCPNFCDIFI